MSVQQAADGAGARPFRQNLRQIASFLISRIRSTTNFARNVRARESSNDAKTIGHYVVPIEDTSDEFGAELKAEEQSDDLARKNEVGATCPAMGNLQSDGKKRSKKQNVEEPSVRVTFEKVHTSGKRLAPQPPKFNAPQAQPSVIVSKVDDDDIKISLEHETEDTPAKIASGPKSPLEQSKEGPSVPVPPLGALPVPTMGPPLLVTDSWRRANADLVLPDIPTPPSQQSSSDSVFTDPEDIALMIATNASVTADSEVSITGLKTPKNLPSTPRNRNFTITGRRKIDLNSPPSQYGTPQSLEATPRRRHSTIEQTPSNSTVLRRVSSFTLSNATARDINKKTQRSTDTNSKVSPELREKFEGQHLVNLLVSGIPENLRNQLSDGDLNKFTAALYAQLQAVGVIKPLGDKITTKNNNFPINQLYYRESSKEKLSNEPKNGDTKISIEYVQTLENDIINLQKQVEKLQTTIDKCQNKQKNSNLVAMRSKASSPIQNTSHDSVEAYDKNSFSSESGRFTATSLDISPISYQFAEKSTDTSSSVHPSNLSPICEVEANVHKGLSRPDSLLISAKKNDTDDSDILDHRIYTDENDKNTAIDTSNKINIVNHSSDARRKLDYIHDDEIINDSCGGDSMKNNFFEIIEKNVSSPTEITSINAPPPPPPMPSAFEPSKPPQMPDDVGPPRPPPMPETVEPSPMPSIIAFPSPPPMPDVYEPSQPRPMLDDIRHSRPPPPPPMPGTVEPPQPPPMPGMFGPPQPPSMPGTVEPPPPPPIPGMFGPPQPPPMPGIIGPPPPPPMPGVIGPPPPPPMVGICGSVPPPPPPIPGISGPPPPPISGLIGFPPSMPPPPPGGFNPPARATMRKQPLVPELPMKPLYWTKINIPVNTKPMISLTSPDTPPIIPLWIEIEEEPVNMKEFADLFSRQVVERKPKVVIDEMSKSSKIQPAKILDTKRSKNVGILERSLRVDFSEVENAVYNLDTSIVSLEALRRIYEILPSAKEMEEITAHEKKHPEIPLDRPEMFLKQLSTIKYFNERIATLMFQSEFQDAVSTVSSKLTNLRSTCEYLCNAQSLKRVMALILTLGNYMNGGNFSRGQADGFDLEILGKLKDVKSKIPGVTLLHYVVRVRLEQEGNYNFDELLPLPVPEPADIEAASTIDFQEISDELDKLDRELHVCEEHSNKVLESCPDNSAAFKEKVDLILNRARNDLTNERENLQDARGKFRGVMFFYQYVPKKSTVDMANPKDFFPLWITFCRDFKDIWKKEQQRLRKERMKNIKSKLEVNRKVETTETVPGGFKDILLKRIAKNKK